MRGLLPASRLAVARREGGRCSRVWVWWLTRRKRLTWRVWRCGRGASVAGVWAVALWTWWTVAGGRGVARQWWKRTSIRGTSNPGMALESVCAQERGVACRRGWTWPYGAERAWTWWCWRTRGCLLADVVVLENGATNPGAVNRTGARRTLGRKGSRRCAKTFSMLPATPAYARVKRPRQASVVDVWLPTWDHGGAFSLDVLRRCRVPAE